MQESTVTPRPKIHRKITKETARILEWCILRWFRAVTARTSQDATVCLVYPTAIKLFCQVVRLGLLRCYKASVVSCDWIFCIWVFCFSRDSQLNLLPDWIRKCEDVSGALFEQAYTYYLVQKRDDECGLIERKVTNKKMIWTHVQN